jgi:hypothetical protein
MELQYMRNDIFDVAVETGEALDFHDIMYKFTLDSFILYVLRKRIDVPNGMKLLFFRRKSPPHICH